MAWQVAAKISSDGKTIKPWTFTALTSPKCTYQNFWDTHLMEKLDVPCKNIQLTQVIGQKTDVKSESSITGTPDMDIIQAMDKYGLIYFDFQYKHVCDVCKPYESKPKSNNPLMLLMNKARHNATLEVDYISNPKTGKEKLQNAILKYFKDNDCSFPKGSPERGKRMLEIMSDLFFYIDGQYSKICDAVCFKFASTNKLPTLFSGFNVPEQSKHAKRSLKNISEAKLDEHVLAFREYVQGEVFLKTGKFPMAMENVFEILNMCSLYISYLKKKAKKSKSDPSLHTAPSSALTEINIKVIDPKKTYHGQLEKVNNALCEAEYFAPINVKELLDTCDRKRIYFLFESMEETGLQFKCAIHTISIGGNKPNLVFIWKIPENVSEGELISQSASNIKTLNENVPKFVSKLVKKQFMETYGFVASPLVLRSIFSHLTSDSRSAPNLSTKEIDQRFEQSLLLEEPGLNVDLRMQNNHKASDQFEVFFRTTEEYLHDDVGVAVQERRHSTILYFAKAVSFPDLHKRIRELVPEGTAVPSKQWLRYQFEATHPNAKTAKYFKGKMNIKCMVQKRQVRVTHVDSHFCACLWRYMREMSICHRDITNLVSMDDKHKVKVGEPGYPLAAVERGKQVLVGLNQVMAVGDHDFSKSTITPSVIMRIDIPETIAGSFYRGNVYVVMKDSILQASSPMRHAAELENVLKREEIIKPVLLLYSDGGPDHRCTYMSVKLSLLGLFLKHDLDVLIALRTAPGNSWANPCERIMSIINLGHQGVGVMRKKGSETFEQVVDKANTMKEVRAVLDTEELRDEWTDCLQSPLTLIDSQMRRLSLKDKSFSTMQPAKEEDMQSLWEFCLKIDDNLKIDKLTAADTKKLERINQYLDHCCIQSHYFFQIKKCGKSECSLCRPLRDERSKDVADLPFPVMGPDDHYLPFESVYRTVTKDSTPSKAMARPKKERKNPFPGKFSPSEQHVSNANMMLQCEECDKWRLLFAKRKLSNMDKQRLDQILQSIEYTCGLMMDDLDLGDDLTNKVYIKDHDCFDHIEKLYYAPGLKNQPICIHCADYLHGWEDEDENYPQCLDCKRPPVQRRAKTD